MVVLEVVAMAIWGYFTFINDHQDGGLLPMRFVVRHEEEE